MTIDYMMALLIQSELEGVKPSWSYIEENLEMLKRMKVIR